MTDYKIKEINTKISSLKEEEIILKKSIEEKNNLRLKQNELQKQKSIIKQLRKKDSFIQKVKDFFGW